MDSAVTIQPDASPSGAPRAPATPSSPHSVHIVRRSIDLTNAPHYFAHEAPPPTTDPITSPPSPSDPSTSHHLPHIPSQIRRVSISELLPLTSDDTNDTKQSPHQPPSHLIVVKPGPSPFEVETPVVSKSSTSTTASPTASHTQPLFPNLSNFNVDLNRGGHTYSVPSASKEPHVVPAFRPDCLSFTRRRWSLLFPAYRRLDLPGFHGFAVVELVFIGLYSVINLALVVASIAQMASSGSSNVDQLESSANNLGTYGTINVLLLLFPITRSSVWQYVLGISFERAIFYHKWLARVAVVELGIHGAGIYAASWYGYQQSTLWRDAYDGGVTGTWASGSISWFIGVAIVAFSLYPFRRLMHEWFLRLHIVLFVAFLVFGFIHQGTVALVAVALVLYAFDWVLRISMWRRPVQVLSLTAMPGGVTRVTFQMPNFTYQAGQWCMVCIPAVTPFEWHPFSFSSSPHHSVMTLHVKTVGRWTRRLEELARTGGDPSHLKMHVEGPYGVLSVPLERYQHVVAVAGGIGVTPLGSIYNELVHEHYVGARTLSHLSLVWAVRDPQLIASLYDDPRKADAEEEEERSAHAPPTFFFSPSTLAQRDALIDSTSMTPRKTTRLHPPIPPLASRVRNAFHITRVDGTAPSSAEYQGVEGGWGEWLQEGRPQLVATFAEMKGIMEAEVRGGGVGGGQSAVGDAAAGQGGGLVGQRCAVLACGPRMMIEEVRKLCIRQSTADVHFDLHEEEFAW